MSFQQITIVGNIGSEPEMRYTQTGTPVCSFSVATSRQWTDAKGVKQEQTTWFRVTAWNKLAEFAAQYLGKGQSVLVLGEMQEPRAWLDSRTGEPRAGLDVTANTIRFAGGKPAGDGAAVAAGVPAAAGVHRNGTAPAAAPAGGAEMSDDIPFA